MRNCAKCKSKEKCITCETGYYLRNDLTGCVRDCSQDDSVTGTKYINDVSKATVDAEITTAICMVNCSYADSAITDYIDATTVAQEHATTCI